jgi:hypothetical protein
MVSKPMYFQNPDEEFLEAGGYGSPGYNISTSATTYSYRSSHILPSRRVPAWDQNSQLPPPVSARDRRLNLSSKSNLTFGGTYPQETGRESDTRADAQTFSYADPRQRRLDPDQELALLVLFVSCAVVAFIFCLALSYA